MEQHNYGSVKNKIVASDIVKERAKIAFDKNELTTYLLGGQDLVDHRRVYRGLTDDHPELNNTLKFNDMTIHERQTDLWKRISLLHQKRPDIWLHNNISQYPYHAWIHNF